MTTDTITITRYTCNTCHEIIMDVSDTENVGNAIYQERHSEEVEPELTFAGYLTPGIIHSRWTHFCSEKCLEAFAEKNNVLRFDKIY